MTIRRAAILFAILTALIAAPSAALGAPPNALLGAAATPTAGTTDTRFTLSVQYLSGGGTSAGSVTATVAGRTLGLSLVAGSPTSGTWATSSRLPAGTWSTTFRALPAKGPQPVLAGPTITVIAATASTPSATPDLGVGADPSNQYEGGGAASPSVTSPTAAPAAPAASPAAEESASPAAVPATTTPAHPSAAPAPGSGGTPATPDPATPNDGTGPSAAPVVPVASAAARAAASAEALPLLPATSLGDGSDAVWTIMIGGLIAVATVALGGGAWLLVGRRRQPATAGLVEPLALSEPLAETTDELLSRRSRSRSRARMKPSDDPVLAAMNLDEPRRRLRASQGDRGSTMRDATGRRGTNS